MSTRKKVVALAGTAGNRSVWQANNSQRTNEPFVMSLCDTFSDLQVSPVNVPYRAGIWRLGNINQRLFFHDKQNILDLSPRSFTHTRKIEIG
jgi:hypothetical protein